MPAPRAGAGGYCIRDADATDMRAITECTAAAFTKFEVFGPPWHQDTLSVPALTACLAPFPISGLSRVAATPTTIIGHAQWNISSMWLGGQWVLSAWLAPLSVHPANQRQGVGAALMKDGLEQLKLNGVVILVLMGHPSYYPRFGLIPRCFGQCALSIPLPQPCDEEDGHLLRPLQVGDEGPLRALWLRLCGQAEGAMDPGPGLLPWCSKLQGVIACCLERNGALVGYARFDARPNSNSATGVFRFLAADVAASVSLAQRITKLANWTGEQLVIPLPFPQVIFPDAKPIYEWSASSMAMPIVNLEVDAILKRCCAKEQSPLFIEWPSIFDE